MTKTIELEVAQAVLGELIASLKPEDDIVIMQNHKLIAKLLATSTVRVAILSTVIPLVATSAILILTQKSQQC